MSARISGFFRLGIFQKMLLTMLVVAVVPLGTIWYIDYKSSLTRISNNVNQQLADVSERLVTHVNDWVLMNLKALRQNAALADMTTMEAEKQNPILKSMLDEYEWSYLVFTIGPDGKNIGRSDDKEPKDYGDRIYFKQVMAGEPMGRQVIVSRTTGEPAIILSAPIYATNEITGIKSVAGVIAIGMSIKEMSEQITNLQVGRTGFAFLLDENGKVVAHQKQEFAKESADFSQHPAFVGRAPAGGKLITYQQDGKNIVAFVQTTDQGWTMVTQQDYEEAYDAVRRANERALILLGVTLVVVTLIAYMFSRRLTNPIRNLTRIANEMSRGKIVMSIIEINRRDELGSLASAIDRMGTSIRLAMERLKAKS